MLERELAAFADAFEGAMGSSPASRTARDRIVLAAKAYIVDEEQQVFIPTCSLSSELDAFSAVAVRSTAHRAVAHGSNSATRRLMEIRSFVLPILV